MESNGSLIAGANHSLQCEVETVVGVRPGDITISWTTPDGTLIETDTLTTEGNVIRGTLELSPLTTSDAGSYTCTGRIQAESVQVDVSSNSSIELNVTSKFSVLYLTSHCLSISVPAPDVAIGVNTGRGSVVQGTKLVIFCSVSISSAVNTEFDISIAWSSDPAETLNQSYVRISEISGSGLEFTRTLSISPVNLTDSALYSCTASISPADSTGVVVSTESTASVNVTVIGVHIGLCVSEISLSLILQSQLNLRLRKEISQGQPASHSQWSATPLLLSTWWSLPLYIGWTPVAL